jgi:hypothetical protein
MNKLAELIVDIEKAIRYLLSGIAVYALFLLSLSNPLGQIKWIEEHLALASFLTVALGFTVYHLYRMFSWVAGDGIAWMFRLSAPSEHKKKPWWEPELYAEAYADFLEWRRSDKNFDEKLNGYLHYRWAVVHFTYIVVITLFVALSCSQCGSVISDWKCGVFLLAVVFLVVATWQASFLFRVERELYKKLCLVNK